MDAYFILLSIDDPYFISTRLDGSLLLPKVHSFIWLAIQICISTRSLLFCRRLILKDEA
jgi:hypothetical protein